MGFSVSVSVKSQQLKSKMYDFLREMYRSWPEVIDVDQEALFRGPDIELLYIHGKCILGFDYGEASQEEREYNFALMRWVALQVGRQRRRFRGEGVTLDRPVPYIVVGGYEPWPILLDTEWAACTDMKWWLTDRLGMNTDNSAVRELAWYHIPDGTHERVSATHHGKSTEEIREALIQAGLDGARQTLHIMRSQVARLDTLWRDT